MPFIRAKMVQGQHDLQAAEEEGRDDPQMIHVTYSVSTFVKYTVREPEDIGLMHLNSGGIKLISTI